MERRLAAILAADLVGYSTLMERDETKTLLAVSSLIETTLRPLVAEHHGRIVKLMGDGILAEFASVVDAVSCATAWQTLLLDHSGGFQFRIGVNLGDIIIQNDDIFGNGVNMAARLEGLAEPGGVCVSEGVYREVHNVLPLVWEDLGEQTVKNISEPVHAFRILSEREQYQKTPKAFAESIGLDFTIPELPSIAVLPFTVMSSDPEQDHFADGITEDIITALSKISRLLVVARNSTFVYKGCAVDVKQVSREQGVRYVLEGSVRSSAGRVRVTAQLIDATSGLHLWAERYDRKMQDIFAVQDDITREIVVAMDVELREGEQHRIWSRGTDNLEAWECTRLATDAVLSGSVQDRPKAIERIDRALTLDPDYAFAWCMRAWLYFGEADVGGGIVDRKRFDEAQALTFDCAHRALALDRDCAEAHAILALAHLNAGDHDKAMELTETAIALAPNNAEILGGVASAVMRKSGYPERGAELVRKAMRLSPVYRPGLLRALGNNYRLAGRLEEAVSCYRESLQRESGYLAPYVNLVSALGELGRPADAADAIARIFEFEPKFSVEAYVNGLSYRRSADRDRIRQGLLKAGMPAEAARAPVYATRDKPSVAVLPFTNMSGDPEQDYFSDGISEDIITGLSRFRTLFIVARNSSFSFKGQNLETSEIGSKLGVQYLLEGSVRKSGNRVRISAQLIDSDTGKHIWADRYDRELEDIFAVQDEVARAIIAVLPGRVQHDVADRIAQKPTENMKAYELLLQGKALRDGLNATDTAKARILFQKALELDPNYARVYMYLADTYVVDLWLGLAGDDAPKHALTIARKGASLDNNDVFIQDQLGYAYLCAGLWSEADVQFQKTLSQIVNEAESMAWCGYGFLLLGQPQKAQEVVDEAVRLDPLHPPALDWILGQIHFHLGHYDQAVGFLIGEALLNSLAHAFLVAAYAHSGREIDAREALKLFISHRRQELLGRGIVVERDSVASLAGGFKRMWRCADDWQRIASGLEIAGLPTT
ncbi:tetratricopeptide repeat protein [Rhodobacteraceae bacterium M382]|nr:tetratricopeptide repeat protein [Rhodobacteraceae bacterium M382]